MAVIQVRGGGIYGCVIAHVLQSNHEVYLHEKEEELLRGASFNNFRRLHRGYHYPFSPRTVKASKKSFNLFTEVYKKFCSPIQIQYLIANEGSKIDIDSYLRFLREMRLPHGVTKSNSELAEWGADCTEALYDITKLRKFFGKILTRGIAKKPDFVIDCTYADSPLIKKKNFRVLESTTLHLDGEAYYGMGRTVLYGNFCGYIPCEEGGIIAYHAALTDAGDILKDLRRFYPELRNCKIIDARKTRHVHPARGEERPFFMEQDAKNIYVIGGKVAQSILCATEVEKRVAR